MTTSELLSLLSFEGDALRSAEIISETELKDKATFIVADLTYDRGNSKDTMRVPFVHYQGEDFIFTPWDWQAPEFNGGTTPGIEEIKWRVGNTEKEAIMLNGLPRIFM